MDIEIILSVVQVVKRATQRKIVKCVCKFPLLLKAKYSITFAKPVISRSAFLNGQLLLDDFLPILVLPDFLFAFLNLSGQFLTVFLSRFRHR